MPAARPDAGLADVNGTRLYYESVGRGHPLVLMHAGLSDSRMWDDQISAFAQHFRVIRFDTRGFGKSDMPTGAFSARADLDALLNFLGVDKAYLIGLSMGGGIAVDFTLEYPQRVEALVAASSGPSGLNWETEQLARYRSEMNSAYQHGNIGRAVELALGMWVDGPNRTSDQVDPEVRRRIGEMMSDYFSRGRRQGRPLPLEPPAIPRLAKIHVPTLVVVGNLDILPLREAANVLASRIPGARQVVIHNAAHMLNMEWPSEFNRIVLDFLDT